MREAEREARARGLGVDEAPLRYPDGPVPWLPLGSPRLRAREALAHDHDYAVLWPLREGSVDVEGTEALLRHCIVRAKELCRLHGGLLPLVDPVDRYEVTWSGPRRPDAWHDALVRVLWESWGRDRIHVDGAPAALRGPGRTLGDVTGEQRKRLAGVVGSTGLGVLLLGVAAHSNGRLGGWPMLVLFGLPALMVASEVRALRTWLRS